MVESGDYCWVVICKNHRYHRRDNLFSGHRILLGETDAVSGQPPVSGEIAVSCDDCGKEYYYRPADLMRMEMDRPVDFTPHPLFRP